MIVDSVTTGLDFRWGDVVAYLYQAEASPMGLGRQGDADQQQGRRVG
jgi:hypothetical protein